MLLPHVVCSALVVGGRLLGAGQQAMRLGGGKLLEQPPSQPAAPLLTADLQQPRHYTPYAVMTQV